MEDSKTERGEAESVPPFLYALPPFFFTLSLSVSAWCLCLAGGPVSAVLAPSRFFPHSDDDIFVPAGLNVLPAFQHL